MNFDQGNKFKLAAIDLDGTLLGPTHSISEENVRAVQRLQTAGAQVVLASGRHYDSIHKYADALPEVRWIVSSQGGEVSDLERKTVLCRKFLLGWEVEKTVAAGRALGFTTIAYMVEGVFTESPWDESLDFYTELAGLKPVNINRAELLKRDIFKVIWIGTAEELTKATAEMPTMSIQVVRTNKRFLEFMPADVSKGTALEVLGSHLGIAAADAVVFGDGDNDIPMFEWAGTSVAMAHGWPQAIKKATCVSPNGATETAFARAVEMILSAGG